MLSPEMSMFVRVFGLVPLDTFIKTLPPVIMFCLAYEKQPAFKLRAAFLPGYIVIASLVVTAMGLSLMNVVFEYFCVYIQFILILIAIFGIEHSLFKASGPALLFNLLGGHALYEIIMYLFLALPARLFPISAMATDSFEYYLVQFIWFFVCYIISWFSFIKRQNAVADDDINANQPALYLSLGMSLFLIAFNIIRGETLEPGSVMDYLCIISLILFFTLILFFRGGQLKVIQSEKELLLERRVWEEKEKSLKLTQDTINTVNIKYHDLKHMLSQLRPGADTIGFAESVVDVLKDYESTVSTGNNTLDMILTEMNLKYAQNGIDFSCIADGSAISFMSSIDIISLFSNALDNACEANAYVSEGDREVYFTIRKTMDMVSIVIENPYSTTLTMKNGLPISIKGNRQYHGFGMKSIRSTVQKYGGDMSITTDNNRFVLRILIPENS